MSVLTYLLTYLLMTNLHSTYLVPHLSMSLPTYQHAYICMFVPTNMETCLRPMNLATHQQPTYLPNQSINQNTYIPTYLHPYSPLTYEPNHLPTYVATYLHPPYLFTCLPECIPTSYLTAYLLPTTLPYHLPACLHS